MKDNQSDHSMGEQIMNALSDALQGGDFNDLNRLVSQSVVNALNEVGKHISFMDYEETQEQAHKQTYEDHRQAAGQTRQTTGQARKTQEQTYRQASDPARKAQQQTYRQASDPARKAPEQTPWQTAGSTPNAKEYGSWQSRDQRRQQDKLRRQEQARWQAQQKYQDPSLVKQQDSPYGNNTALSPLQFKKVGNVSNVLYQVFGGIGLGLTILMTLIHFAALLLANDSAGPLGWIANLFFLALFAGMIRLGIGQRRRLKLAERYAKLCSRTLYGEIEHLARSTGRKTRRVIKDLQKMMRLGMFPEGHLDEKRTCFMLNDAIYRQYLETENNCRLREAASQRTPAPQETQKNPETDIKQTTDFPGQEAELNAMIAEGMECIRKLHLLNDKIPGEVISAKLSRMENLLGNLFDSVREHPDQMHRMHKLMNYYLPTTLKLVEAYEEFDRVSTPGDDIIAAKAEIENTLDTINQAFTELLNNLFQDAVLDATTDAQVLKTMLAREGLMSEMDLTVK